MNFRLDSHLERIPSTGDGSSWGSSDPCGLSFAADSWAARFDKV